MFIHNETVSGLDAGVKAPRQPQNFEKSAAIFAPWVTQKYYQSSSQWCYCSDVMWLLVGKISSFCPRFTGHPSLVGKSERLLPEVLRLEILKNLPKKRLSPDPMRLRRNTSRTLEVDRHRFQFALWVFFLAGSFAHAAVHSAQFGVSAIVEDRCTVNSSLTIEESYKQQAETSATVQCVLGSSYRMAVHTASQAEFSSAISSGQGNVGLPVARPIVDNRSGSAGLQREGAVPSTTATENLLLLTVEY